MLLKKRDMQLIAVTDTKSIREGLSLHDAVKRAIIGGASTVMMSDDTMSDEEYMREAARIKIMCGMYDIPFLVYENVTVAEAVDADGIAVRLKDFNQKEIRRKFGMERSAGVITTSEEEAIEAARQGASFIFFGPMYGGSKRGNKKIEKNAGDLMKLCSTVEIPVVAYGGIADVDLNDLRGTGVCGFGVAGGIFGSDDISEAAMRLRKLAIDVL